MKLIILTFCMLLVAVQNVCGDEESMKSFKECLDENDIKGDIEKLKENDDPKLRCIMACVMEKEGILKNGNVQLDKLKQDLLKDAERLGEKKISEIVNTCGDLAKELTDVCDQANVVGMCIKEEFAKYDINFEK
ncbi:pheromone-binding protein Gp-9-like [Phymastichus coffea]|uniref:pheromone-binding protein Gp-9-like n=1 Tax=Phymastichus coffea TaxID=108790 RepID=UPI00273C5E66|nr:pheromone-binding protein Gp-9-like [Phymastichus coffea]